MVSSFEYLTARLVANCDWQRGKLIRTNYDLVSRLSDPDHKTGAHSLSFPTVIYLVSDLQAVDGQLKELEEEDEIALSLLQSLKSKRPLTRSRRSEATVEEVETNNVEKYVEEKREWVKFEQQVELSLFLPA